MKTRFTKREFVKYLEMSQSLSLIVSVSRNCVLRCKYCYARTGDKPCKIKVLPYDLLEKVVRDAFETRHNKISFEWTGGEALLAGWPFFEKVLLFQDKYKNGKQYENIVQTSGGLYNESLYDYLIEKGFKVSITIDGPQKYHDSQRPLNCGKGSFDTVLKSFKYLKEKQGNCGVLCTITRPMRNAAKEIFDFYTANGINNWLSNPYIYDPNKRVKEKRLGLNNDEYANYFITQYNHWLEKDDVYIHPGYILNLSEELASISNYSGCTHGGRCLTNFINIDPDGNAYNCPKFLGYKEHLMGNVRDKTIADLISPDNPRMEKYLTERKISVNRCLKKKCSCFAVCNGGCPYSSILKGGDDKISHEDIFCEGKKRLFEHINKRMKQHKIATVAV